MNKKQQATPEEMYDSETMVFQGRKPVASKKTSYSSHLISFGLLFSDLLLGSIKFPKPAI